MILTYFLNRSFCFTKFSIKVSFTKKIYMGIISNHMIELKGNIYCNILSVLLNNYTQKVLFLNYIIN